MLDGSPALMHARRAAASASATEPVIEAGVPWKSAAAASLHGKERMPGKRAPRAPPLAEVLRWPPRPEAPALLLLPSALPALAPLLLLTWLLPPSPPPALPPASTWLRPLAPKLMLPVGWLPPPADELRAI